MSKQVYAKGERLALKEEVDAALLLKQDVLTAGDNIDITNNVISGNYSNATTETAGLMSAGDKNKLDNVEEGAQVTQYDEIPQASQDLEGKIIQYVGDTNEYYTTAYYYICEDDGQGGYVWNEINVQPEAELPADLKVYKLNVDDYNSNNPFLFSEHPTGIYIFVTAATNSGENLTFCAKYYSTDRNLAYLSNLRSGNIMYYFNDDPSTRYIGFIRQDNYVKGVGNDVNMYYYLYQIQKYDDFITITTGYGGRKVSMPEYRETISGLKTFTTLPESSVTPTTANQLTNKAYVDSKLSAAVKRSVVQELPSSDIDENTIYMTPAEDPSTGNVYDEYIYVNNSWEKIGSTETDLSNYIAKDNTTAFTPTGDYNPATKKYVDDTDRYIGKTNYYNTQETALDVTNFVPSTRYILKHNNGTKTMWFKYNNNVLEVQFLPKGTEKIVDNEYYLTVNSNDGNNIQIVMTKAYQFYNGVLVNHFTTIRMGTTENTFTDVYKNLEPLDNGHISITGTGVSAIRNAVYCVYYLNQYSSNYSKGMIIDLPISGANTYVPMKVQSVNATSMILQGYYTKNTKENNKYSTYFAKVNVSYTVNNTTGEITINSSSQSSEFVSSAVGRSIDYFDFDIIGFDPSTSYNIGDCVLSGGSVYKCITPTSGSWDSNCWEEISTKQYFKDLVLNNTSQFIPTSDYNLTTKKYVDDAVANIDVSGKEDKTNKTTTVTSSSTDTQYASAKAVYDYVEGRLGDIDTILTEILNGSVNGEGMSF